jgi:DNA modification methylase
MAGKMACAPGSPALLIQHSNVLFFRKPGGRKGVYKYPEQSNTWKAKWCRSVWEDVQPAHDQKHPAVMPELMASSIIQGWSLPGQTVLDLFMGRGTTLSAAQKSGRKAIGIDKTLKYCKDAALRLSQKVLITEVPSGQQMNIAAPFLDTRDEL